MKSKDGKSLIRILMIDDDQEDYLLVSNLLRDKNPDRYLVEWEPDPDVAVKKTKQQNFDVFLIDYRLNKKTGIDVLTELKSFSFDKPMILLTGFDDDALDLIALENGAWDFISKKLITGELLERSIRYCIRRSEDLQKVRKTEKLEREKYVAEAANHAKSQFLASMSHEIRTPLSALLGFCDLARDQDTSEMDRLNYLNVIKQNGIHLLDLVNDILDLSKIEAGQMSVTLGACSWRRQINEILQLMQLRASEKKIRLEFDDDKNLPDIILTDGRRFHQIMLNLIGNAVKFTKEGLVVVSARLVTRNNPTHPELRLSVHDTGVGIHTEDQKKLFKPFSQAHTSMNKIFEGTGLGLHLSQRLAKLLGGVLELSNSKPGVGSIFTFRFPFQPGEKVLNVKQELTNLFKLRPKDSNVLVIDDSLDNLALVKIILNKFGYRVETSPNAREGISKALRGNFDVILMDIQMPEMDGYEATSELRMLGFKKPIIALSAHANVRSDLANQVGFDAYITKPINREELISTVENQILEKYESQKTRSESV